MKSQLEARGIEVGQFQYKKITLNSYNSVSLKDVALRFRLSQKTFGKNSCGARLHANSIAVRLASFNEPSLYVTLEGFDIIIDPGEQMRKSPFAELRNGYVSTIQPLHPDNPFESAKSLADGIENLFNEDFTTVNLHLKGSVPVSFDSKKFDVRLFTERKNDTTFLKFNKADVRKVSEEFDLGLVDAEIAIIAAHPSKVPAMIQITRQAKTLSEREKRKDPAFPEDAFRHLYWSYHLTRALGPALAKKITDAHETAPGNTKAERMMDFHNNEFARDLAKKNLTVNDLKRIARYSGQVIKQPPDNKDVSLPM